MPIGTFGRGCASPYPAWVLFCDSPRSMMVRPQKWVGRGTGVNRLKFGATAWPPRTVISFWSQRLRSWPSYGLPPPARNGPSVTETVWVAPTQPETMPVDPEAGAPEPAPTSPLGGVVLAGSG